MQNIKIQQMPEEISTKKDIIGFFNKKIECFQKMILYTLLGVQKYKILNFFSAKEFNLCIQGLETINEHFCEDKVTFVDTPGVSHSVI